MDASRELDMAVARIFGCQPRMEIIELNGPVEFWSCTCPVSNEGQFPHGGEELLDSEIRHYSTDPASVGEMLEWAASRGGDVNLEWDTSAKRWGAWLWGPNALDLRPLYTGDGTTPQEALARAIAATGEE